MSQCNSPESVEGRPTLGTGRPWSPSAFMKAYSLRAARRDRYSQEKWEPLRR